MIKTLISGMALGVFFSAFIVWIVFSLSKTPIVEPAVPPLEETCWSGTFAVQLPEMPDSYWITYANKGATNVQICGIGLRVGDIIAFPDFSRHLIDMENERNAWRDCALGGPPLCPEDYAELKAMK